MSIPPNTASLRAVLIVFVSVTVERRSRTVFCWQINSFQKQIRK